MLLSLLAATFLLASFSDRADAQSFADNGKKYNPGLYLAFGGGTGFATMAGKDHIQGAMKSYRWRVMEPSEGVYDFSEIHANLDALEAIGKRLIISFQPSTFGAGGTPTAPEYITSNPIYGDAGAMLLIEVDGNDAARVEAELFAIGDLCEKHGAIEVYVGEDRTTIERLWSVRRNIAEAFKVASPVQSLEDIVVPVASIPDVLPELERLSATYGMQIPCYGHAGDGNLHATLVKDPAMDLVTWHANKDACLR